MEDLDYLVVGAGLFGAVFAHEAKKRGRKVLVIDKREHIGGNVYSYEKNGIMVHHYGAHIFLTTRIRKIVRTSIFSSQLLYLSILFKTS